MCSESENLLLACAAVVQFLGFAGVIAARLRGSQPTGAVMGFMLFCFVAVGIASLVLLNACASGYWFASSVTMPVMAVAATLDLRRTTSFAGF